MTREQRLGKLMDGILRDKLQDRDGYLAEVLAARLIMLARKGSLKAIELILERPTSRDLYPKHLEFFAAGANHRERLFCAANRIGKSSAGAYELTVHMTGLYPGWWTGKRFERPISAWAAGDSSKTTRDVIQEKLLGRPGQFGQGMIPKDRLLRWTPRAGTPDAVETIYVRYVNGGVSQI